MRRAIPQFVFLLLTFGFSAVADPCLVYIEATAALLHDPVISWKSEHFNGSVLRTHDEAWSVMSKVVFEKPVQHEIGEYVKGLGRVATDRLRRKAENRVNLYRDGYRWRLAGNHSLMPVQGDLLVVGCANGVECGHLAVSAPTRTVHYTNIEAVAVQMTTDEMNFVGRLIPDLPRGRGFVADVTHPVLPQNAYDGILMNDTVAFFSADTRRMAMLYATRSLREGGVLLIQDVNLTRSGDLLSFMNGLSAELMENEAPVTDFELALIAANFAGVLYEAFGEGGLPYHGVYDEDLVEILKTSGEFQAVRLEQRGDDFRILATKKRL